MRYTRTKYSNYNNQANDLNQRDLIAQNFQAELDSLKIQLSASNSMLSQAERSLSDYRINSEAQTNILTTKIRALENERRNLQEKFANSDITTHPTYINLSNQLNELRTSLTNKNSDYTTLMNNYNALRESKGAITDDIDKIESTNSTSAEISQLKAEIQGKDSIIRDLNTQLIGLNSKIGVYESTDSTSSFEKQLAELAGKFASLEREYKEEKRRHQETKENQDRLIKEAVEKAVREVLESQELLIKQAVENGLKAQEDNHKKEIDALKQTREPECASLDSVLKEKRELCEQEKKQIEDKQAKILQNVINETTNSARILCDQRIEQLKQQSPNTITECDTNTKVKELTLINKAQALSYDAISTQQKQKIAALQKEADKDKGLKEHYFKLANALKTTVKDYQDSQANLKEANSRYRAEIATFNKKEDLTNKFCKSYKYDEMPQEIKTFCDEYIMMPMETVDA